MPTKQLHRNLFLALYPSLYSATIFAGAFSTEPPPPRRPPRRYNDDDGVMKATVYVGLTLDGHIAASDGSVDFLTPYQTSASEEDGDMGFAEFMDSVDLLLMGRRTWDQVVEFGEDAWPYGEKNVWIWSTREPSEVNIPESRRGRARVVRGSPSDVLETAREEGFGHVYVDGGTTVREFMRHDCIQEFILTRVPLLLGSGIPLFASDGGKRLELEHLKTTSFSNGLVQCHYRVSKHQAEAS